MRHLDLFSGIGGFSLAASWVWDDLEIVSFCEQDKFCQKVLKKHWPDVPIFDDIYTLKGDQFGAVDIITGGFPCQPFSVAGKQRGSEDDRYLWPEMLRVIKEAKPRWVVGENVTGIINLALDDVLASLENIGYETQAFIIPACGVDAPHRRDRVWIVAHSERNRRRSRRTTESRQQRSPSSDGASMHVANSCGMGRKPRAVKRETIPEETRRAESCKRSDAQGQDATITDKYCPFCNESYPLSSWEWEAEERCPDCGNVANADRTREPQQEGSKQNQRGRTIDSGQDVPNSDK